ncbi:bacillithiol biosynthesis cysteine-adding enzyme BshC [Bacillus sp. FJAT-27231]|uniref:bacillithiol biosynthesis cysteine-adding enzyme BshC n=1 Tax=Bacillus sp. FJAT-27231 TaxID=1679168 RepID=UPI000670A4E5|nr:bacillithiol biosynthesis cysteine-adding enzyme BshC [Bacillus sp. FJAT-27231]KMY53529.1 bacillithiol biosynthesis cysteine-adding enzyme BshC [Bacillus sp. FJAT-27231]
MELAALSVPAINRFASLYLKQEAPVTDFFHYNLSDQGVYEKRVADLQARTYMRASLAACIEAYMKPFTSSAEVMASLEKLKDERSAVVIGGQQAGLLTGPLYTIHKVISIIKLAREKEQELSIPVVPVFWIAGEDHDFPEVNHVYVESESMMEKMTYPERIIGKKIVSDIQYDKQQMISWIKKIFSKFGETNYTNELLNHICEEAEKANTITDFFSRLIHALFNRYGLLLIDSAYKPLRELEKPFFKQLIEQAEEITEAVEQSQKIMSDLEFNQMIELSSSAANLFLYENEERVLLEYNPQTEVFSSKNRDIQHEKAELLALLEKEPEKFSNNVVTRPLMQEWLFPTLAFIAGPGEIAYWAELKGAFEWLDMKMPPIEARLNMTIVERAIARDLEELHISLSSAVQQGVAEQKEEFWHSVRDDHFHEMIAGVQQSLMEQYDELEKRAQDLHKETVPIILKNRDFHLNQLAFLTRKTDEMIQRRHAIVLHKYDKLQNALRPIQSPQERIRNVYEYLNKYGPDFIHELMELEFTFTGDHYLVKI